jgi:RNA polymerase sigma-70 factor (ECF subfamily)
MTTQSWVDDRDEADDGGPLPGITAALQRLVGNGLGPALGLGPDRRMRSAVARVARLGPDELARRLDLVYSEQSGSFVGYATRILGSREDAEDVVNEAFARVLRADPDLQAPEALVPYVRTVVRNEARDRGSQNTRDRHERQIDIAELDDRLTAGDRPLDDRVCDEISLALAVRTLPDRQRQCFALRFVDGLSVRDTAARMNISDGNVKRLSYEVRSRLAALLTSA